MSLCLVNRNASQEDVEVLLQTGVFAWREEMAASGSECRTHPDTRWPRVFDEARCVCERDLQ